MDLNFSVEELAFRDEVREFLGRHLPADLVRKGREGRTHSKQDYEIWHALLRERGWLATTWPLEYGGTGWGPIERYLFDQECALAHAPRIQPFGLNLLGPVLIRYGSQAQKDYWLPRIVSGEDWWCQGFSEPGAGSDLASLQTSARREGDHYVINGQKTWTTLGQYANRIFCLVRTDRQARLQSGISLLLVDMDSPGIEVRPIITLDGEHEVNEVFFDEVRVPVDRLVGEENRGWDYAKYMLTHERTTIAGVGNALAVLQRLRSVAAKVQCNGRPLAYDPLFAARIARVEIELENTRTTNLRVIAAAAANGDAPAAESSMLKIRGTQIRQELLSLVRRAMGPHARLFSDEFVAGGDDPAPVEGFTAAAQYFNGRKLSIFGGSTEIQRNIIAKTILGL